MLKIIKKVVITVISLLPLLLFNKINASSVKYYQVNQNELSQQLKDKISSIYFRQNDENLILIFNGVDYQPSYNDPSNMEYRFINNGVNYFIKVNLKTKEIMFSYTFINENENTICCYLATENGTFTIYVYPNLSSNRYYKIEGKKVDEGIIFDDLYIDEYNVQLSTRLVNAQYLEITCNGTKYTSSIKTTFQKQYVFLEKLVVQHNLPLEYYTSISKTGFNVAQNRVYSLEEIKSVANHEVITLVNKTNGLYKDVLLTPVIGYWKRIGEEMYDTNYENIIKVIGQYDDSICSAIRDNEAKTYHIVGEEYIVDELASSVEISLYYDYENMEKSKWLNSIEFSQDNNEKYNIETAQLIKYANVGQWEEYKYSDNLIEPSISREVKPEYSYRTYTYTDYSDYIYSKDQVSKLDDDLITNKILYARSILKWSDYSENVYEATSKIMIDCQNDSLCKSKSVQKYGISSAIPTGKYGSFITSCSATDQYRCDKYYKYTCSGLVSSTVYSTNKYNINETGPCKANNKVTSMESGFRKSYISFNEPTKFIYDECTYIAGVNKCYAKTMYKIAYGTWSDYSEYKYEKCVSSTDAKCKSTVLFAKRSKVISKYSEFVEILPNISNLYDYTVRYRYRERDIISYGLDYIMPDGTVFVSKLTYYRYEYPALRKKENLIYKPEKQYLGNLENYNENEIRSLALDCARKYTIVNSINDEGYISYEEYERLTTSVGANNRIYESFLNHEMYLPNIYVTKHYRATKALLDVECYTSSISISLKSGKQNNYNCFSYLENYYPASDDRIVFFDETKPFSNYDTLPENWDASVINEIKMALEKETKTIITISKQELEEMYAYVTENGSTGLVEKFKHLITEKE